MTHLKHMGKILECHLTSEVAPLMHQHEELFFANHHSLDVTPNISEKEKWREEKLAMI